ncbi:hypothetical protein P3434_23605, partial [Vibrio parahaemolyticus]|nr:hypothetical protein [Vibrio parahaemolyticus]
NLQLGIYHYPKIKMPSWLKPHKRSFAASQQSFELNSHSLNQRVTLVTSKLGSNDSKLTA